MRLPRAEETGGVPPPDELDVLAGLARGHTVHRIARDLAVSERTVRRRLRSAADRLGADTTMQTVVAAVRRGLI